MGILHWLSNLTINKLMLASYVQFSLNILKTYQITPFVTYFVFTNLFSSQRKKDLILINRRVIHTDR